MDVPTLSSEQDKGETEIHKNSDSDSTASSDIDDSFSICSTARVRIKLLTAASLSSYSMLLDESPLSRVKVMTSTENGQTLCICPFNKGGIKRLEIMRTYKHN